MNSKPGQIRQPITIKNQPGFEFQVITAISQLTEFQETFLSPFTNSPFNQLTFLRALETSGSVGGTSGWLPQYHLIFENELFLGMLICFEKHHSYGEYVFDWAWAQAYQQHGLDYYPKLLCAIPFTPVPCNKWLGSDRLSELDIFAALNDYYYQTSRYSGLHLNFPVHSPKVPAKSLLMSREGCQFHWFNRDINRDNFSDFEHFLSTMTARKRKSIKKERRQIVEMGIECVWKSGLEVSATELSAFYHFYQMTYAKRRQTGYLTQSFFESVFLQQSDNIRLLICSLDDEIVATALYFVDETTLYGRYWGSNDQFELLHFEACYYQGIEYCINNHIQTFNPGTQGEHKISRGFEPTKTYSYHSIYLEPFQQPIARFCRDEKQYNEVYMTECSEKLPFKKQQ